nr:class II glutamine amidotransferase [Succinivibrionaceae bacterium]
MCELFGLSSRDKIEVNEYLRAFFRHSEQHPHGWGLAQFFGNAVQIEKEPVAAVESQYLNTRLSFPIDAKSLIAHIRLASVGRLRYENCHPFVLRDIDGRAWTFAHNGTIFSPGRSNGASIDFYKDRQQGGTDSERVLLYLIDRINQKRKELGRRLEAEDRFTLLDELIAELSHSNKLNLLIWDGEYLYAHTNYADTLFTRKITVSGSLLIATKPIDNLKWEHVPFLQLQVYKDGETVWQGRHKSDQFFDREKNWEYRNIDFASL